MAIKTKMPAREMIALAFRVYNANDGKVFKDTEFDSDGNVIKESSKRVLANLVRGDAVPTEAELEFADTAIQNLSQRKMISELTGDRIRSDFVRSVISYAEQELVTTSATGIAVWVPKVHLGFINKDVETEKLAVAGATSDYIGKVRDKVELELEVVSSRFVPFVGRCSVVAKTANNNLVTFWNGIELAGKIKVTGRVRSHEVNKYAGNNKTTTLNYVKVLEPK